MLSMRLVPVAILLAVACLKPAHVSAQCQNEWQPLGSGLSSDVYALGGFDGALVAGGLFDTAGGVQARSVALWNETNWSPIGTGMGGPPSPYVLCLGSYGGSLIAGGVFTTAGGTSANRIAAWNGASWFSLEQGFTGAVRALCLYNGELIAGGSFGSSGGGGGGGGSEFNHIARWNGTHWRHMSNGVDSDVSALTIYNNQLMAGGGGISRWTGQFWQQLGGTDTAGIFALSVYGNELIAAGNFTQIGGVPANNIARWNGSTWQAMGSGMNGWVYCLLVHNGTLYAGGLFTTAGGTTAKRIASWNGGNWQPLGTGMNGAVTALGVYNGDLIAGGGFSSAGDTPASRIARWRCLTLSPQEVCFYVEERELSSGVVGHGFLELRGLSGFVSGQSYVLGFRNATANIFGGNGIVSDDATHDWDYKICYPITSDQWNAIAAGINAKLDSSPAYHILQFNCIDWITEKAGFAGIALPGSINELGIADPLAFWTSLDFIGDGGTFNGGTVIQNPNREEPFAGRGGPSCDDFGFHEIDTLGHSDPAGLAARMRLPYQPVSLGTVTASVDLPMVIELQNTSSGGALISVNWGDGSPHDMQEVVFSHQYLAGSYVASVLVVNGGAVNFVTMEVDVAPGLSTSPVSIYVPTNAPSEEPNPGCEVGEAVPFARCGDIDGDDDVDADDASIFVQVLLGLVDGSVHVASSDCNHSGSVDGLDIGCFVEAMLTGQCS